MLFKVKYMRMFVSFKKMSTVTFRHSGKVEVGKYVLLSIPVITFGLGTWQIQRRSWKLKLIEELESKSKAPPIDLVENMEDLAKLEYCPVHVRGVFDHSKEVYIGPRSLVNNRNQSSSSLLSSQSSTGYNVVTPFKLADIDMTVLVNRGWVPKSKLSPKVRQEGQITDEVDVVGLVRLTEKRPVFAAKNKPGSKLFFFRDIDIIAENCDAAPVFLDANFESTVAGGPVGGQTRVTLRNEHLSYIVTWYSLSAITAWLWYKRYIHYVP